MHFKEIPQVVWKLFDETINHGKSVNLLGPSERSRAYAMAWGWDPPLMVPGDRSQLTFHGLAAYAWREEQGKKKRTGRPRTGEPDGFYLVEAALVKWHGYEKGGVLAKHDPANVKALAKLSGKSVATVSRFLEEKFGKPGHKKYVIACRREEIGIHLAKWQGDLFQDQLDRAVARNYRQDD